MIALSEQLKPKTVEGIYYDIIRGINVVDIHKRGRRAKLTQEMLNESATMLLHGCTLVQVVQALQQKYNLKISVTCLYNAVTSKNIMHDIVETQGKPLTVNRLQKTLDPTKRNTPLNKEQRLQVVQQFLQLQHGRFLVFIDETHWSLESLRGYAWCLKGDQRAKDVVGANKTISALTAITSTGKVISTVFIGGSIDHAVFETWICTTKKKNKQNKTTPKKPNKNKPHTQQTLLKWYLLYGKLKSEKYVQTQDKWHYDSFVNK
ncbi:DDE domain [Hexamita inflata]|uniref:DDE domain n=1 Tax=Hexamita inflata TaxID=28002 RepID=A0AA86UMI4_9EUKA|nr:DDE domain [Hexamita inflata]